MTPLYVYRVYKCNAKVLTEVGNLNKRMFLMIIITDRYITTIKTIDSANLAIRMSLSLFYTYQSFLASFWYLWFVFLSSGNVGKNAVGTRTYVPT